MVRNGTIYSRKDNKCYGMGLGIMILDDVYPGFPGDVRNASGYPFPIQYEVVKGIDIKGLVHGKDKSIFLKSLRESAKNLENLGCRAIAAECGYFSFFQKEIAESVEIPVFLSSLLQVPWAQQLISPKRTVGILVANKSAIVEKHLSSVGIEESGNYVIGSAMEDGQCPEFDSIWTDELRRDPPSINYEKAEADFVKAAVRFYEGHPNMGAMVMECTGFPPFAAAVQREIDIPIFSWSTLLDYAYSVVVHRRFSGHV